MSIYDNEKSAISPDINPTAPQKPRAYHLKKLTEIEAYLPLMKLKFVKGWE